MTRMDNTFVMNCVEQQQPSPTLVPQMKDKHTF